MNEQKELTWLRRLRRLSERLSQTREVERLLPKILETAIELTDAERGFLVRFGRRGPRDLRVEVALGFDGEALRGATGKVSRTIVQRVVQSGRAVVTSREEDADLLDASSVQARRVRSVACVPMRLRGKLEGVLYLDHRFEHQAFDEHDLPCLEAFADQAMLALETAELHRAAGSVNAALRTTLAELSTLEAPTAAPSDRLPDPGEVPRFGSLVGASAAAQQLYEAIERCARSSRPAHIVGEAGAGKALVAREIHMRSTRSHRAFVVQSCSGIDPRELDALLFGRTTLAFTQQEGAFERAGSGTLYLRDVDALDRSLQRKLLDVVVHGTTAPVGNGPPRLVDCRLIVSFSRAPEELAQEGTFREDLIHLLDVQRVEIPPLRDRAEDIPALLSSFLAEVPGPIELDPGTMDALVDYGWPGNVRELKNLAERVIAGGSARLSARDLPRSASTQPRVRPLEEVRRELIVRALEESKGKKSAAARKLGIPRSSLYRLLERYGIS